ncbi:hypothetical protein ACOSP7_017670 [Xanthoceras sorbifolium]|uniref:Uncharacterized protein n=1 Tax=Xanthoceras sorbifolium TaxID=99658 RepID=A0ABQ8HZU3_9ROSI|nr:hypothetical protein JRO89_XS05G0005000 [Xanthoceras sorbifolium]
MEAEHLTSEGLLVAEARVVLPCKSDEECKEMKCVQGIARCVLNQCRCRETILDDARRCKFNDECKKQCPPNTIANCVGGVCLCSKNA